jgi:hypothetical protein
MTDLATAIGLVLVIEGVVYALVPEAARRALAVVMQQPVGALRLGGLVAIAAGFGIVWAARSL